MARKSKKSSDFNLPQINTSRSYVSLAYGIVTVVVLFIIIFLGIRSLSQNGGQVSEEGQTTEEIALEDTRVHTVQEGETLYSIAEDFYQNGELWPTIAAENNIENPDALEAGTELTIPEADESELAMEEGTDETEPAPTEAAMEEETEEPTEAPVVEADQEDQTTEGGVGGPVGQPITGNEYTVVQGDNLWTIAQRAYGDGYRWVDIAKANNLVNPDLIHPGNKFSLPR